MPIRDARLLQMQLAVYVLKQHTYLALPVFSFKLMLNGHK